MPTVKKSSKKKLVRNPVRRPVQAGDYCLKPPADPFGEDRLGMVGLKEVNIESTSIETPEETASNVLTAIRQHEPEQQLEIISTVLREIGIDMMNRERSSHEQHIAYSRNLEYFCSLNPHELLKKTNGN